MTPTTLASVALGLMLTGMPSPAHAEPVRFFKIRVADDRSGRGVPLVELRTVHGTRYHTDSSGLVAFYEPGLMGRKVFFFVQSHGYEFPKDGFGFAGTALDVREGGSAEIKIRRRNLAERLYRVTGAGIYHDSVLLGERVPIREPLLNAQVAGQDSVLAVPWRGRIYWVWGDTSRPAYPLGLFRVSGATSELPGHGGLAPGIGVDLQYFAGPDGFSKAMCPIEGPGPVWLEGLLTVRDEAGQERLVARYMRMKSLGEMLEHGLAVFDETERVFKKRRQFDLSETWRCPRGHPILQNDGGVAYYLFPQPYAVVRVKAEMKCVADPSCYEAFTCLVPGGRLPKAGSRRGPGTEPSGARVPPHVERTADGRLVYGWKPNTDPIAAPEELELVAAGEIKPDEARYQPRDVDTRKTVEMHSGSIHWNAFRKKWIMIAVQARGTSFLGEVWFAEADSPTGPWLWATKVATHDKYSFYNPVHHPFFDEDGGRVIYLEGTYSQTFSGNPDPTPRYDYNQIMYRLDLADPRLSSPLAPK